MPLSQFNCRAHKICFRRPQKNTFGRRVINILLRMRDAAYFFLLLALVGRLYGSHVWAKEIEYVFFLLVLPKTSGSVQIDLTRIEQRNSTGIWLAAQHIAKSKYYFPMAGERVSRKYSQAEWNTSHFIILHPAINIARGIGSHFTYAYFAHIEAS